MKNLVERQSKGCKGLQQWVAGLLRRCPSIISVMFSSVRRTLLFSAKDNSVCQWVAAGFTGIFGGAAKRRR